MIRIDRLKDKMLDRHQDNKTTVEKLSKKF